ncbi:hypothetical protein [Demequina aurantiaca]|uniref:hypothetical protein n=1 Tax=Demequina aurantiaca TaxID=676200 RepID=UPI003D33C0BA
MAEVGKAELTIIPSFKGGQKALEKQLSISSTGAVNASGKQAGGAFLGGMKSIIGPAAAVLSAGVAVDFAKGAIDEASSLGESVNALDVIYGDLGKTVNSVGEDAARNLGLSNLDFNQLAVQFSGFSKTIAGDGGDVVDTLESITGRAADFASVVDLDVAEAAQLFQSALAGESEPLRKYSIDVSAAAVDAFAYAEGIAKTGEKLTEAQKVQARYGVIMKETSKTQGDFANTSDSLANSQRILTAEWDNMRAELGEKLLPVMTDVTGWLLDDGLPALQGFVNDLDDPATTIGSIVESLTKVGEAGAGALTSLWDVVGDDVTGGIATGADYAADLLEGLTNVLDAGEEGGMEGALAQAAKEGGNLSDWAASGDSAGQKFVGAIDAVFAAHFGGSFWGDWLDGAQGILGDFQEGKPVVTVTPGAPRPPANDDIAPITASLPNGAIRPDGSIGPVGAAGGTTQGSSAGNTIVNIGVVNASDTKDIVTKAQATAKTNSWSGSRGIDPRLTR